MLDAAGNIYRCHRQGFSGNTASLVLPLRRTRIRHASDVTLFANGVNMLEL
jgi:hypothetical protein